jgi:NADH:ubiquinone oxidoreductase subunit F (NADH-binding)
VTAPPQGPHRLLAEWLRRHRPDGLDEHAARFGRLPAGGSELIAEVGHARLGGRGGAWFPVHRKLSSVAAARGRRHVIVNGADSEPLSGKDTLLLQAVPHLVLDGAELVAQSVGATAIAICVPATMRASVQRAVDDRGHRNRAKSAPTMTVFPVPPRYTAGEASALAHLVESGVALPRSRRPHESGVSGAATAVCNAETLAQLALIARYGGEWFRSGETMLVTLIGVHRPGVFEVRAGAPGAAVLAAGGGPAVPWQAVLVGGYGGQWVPADAFAAAPFSVDGLAGLGATPGAGVLAGLPVGGCGLAETARLAGWLAGQSARQCGPCFNGLPAIADDLARITFNRDVVAKQRLAYRLDVVDGRGACGHPDGAVGLVRSALRAFGDDLIRHLKTGPCPGAWSPRVVPLPGEDGVPAVVAGRPGGPGTGELTRTGSHRRALPPSGELTPARAVAPRPAGAVTGAHPRIPIGLTATAGPAARQPVTGPPAGRPGPPDWRRLDELR